MRGCQIKAPENNFQNWQFILSRLILSGFACGKNGFQIVDALNFDK